jgi:undecaprenyl-diphosphatase
METIELIITSILLGIVEGITEFLPISSTGHLIIFENILGFTSQRADYVKMYTYVIQLGAIAAILVLYWGKIKNTLTHFFPKGKEDKESGLRFWSMVVIACIPGVVCVAIFDDLAEKYLFNAPAVAVTLFLGGIAMIYAENRFRTFERHETEIMVTPKQALLIGLCQCLAIIPGMSRSASTIIGGWVAGLSTIAAAEFSFFLAIPVMAGMSLINVIQIGGLSSLTLSEGVSLGVGFLVSFLVALVVVKKFITYLHEKTMKGFAIYRMIFAVVVLIAGITGLF